MSQVLSNVLAVTRFIPHGHCYLWISRLVWLHVVSDFLIAIAYYSIPITLVYFVHKRQDLPYPSIFLLFAAFIISCGSTHMMEIWTLWHPNYWLSGFVKVFTALISCFTALELIPLVPKALALPSPEKLEAANLELEGEIAERRKLETALRQSEERYRAIVEDQTELIARLMPEGTLTFVNQAYCRYFGREKEELIGNSYKSFLFLEDQQRSERLLKSLTKENPVETIEHRVIVNGEIRWMQWSNRAIFDQQGNLIEFQAVGRDTTKRKQAEQALQERESILRSFYNSAPMMMGVVKLVENDILHISDNATTAVFFGLTPETVKGRLASEMGVPQAIMQEWIGHYRQSELTGHPVSFEYVHQTDKGAIDLSVTVSPIAKITNEESWFSYIAEDITERKQAKALKEKEILLKEIHHRVKNNLQVICSLLNLQARSLKDKLILEQFKESQNRVRAMALIHEQLYQSPNLSRINLAEYIYNLTNNLFCSYTIYDLNITKKIEINRDFFLDIDTAVPCGLIINELVSNALKYAFKIRKKGEIYIQAMPDEEGNLVLTISDNGRGLPPDFDLEQTKSLGLKLVKNLTNQLRGEIKVNSDLGTQFQITLTRIKVNNNN
ncbi:PAS domain S-box protein [Pleurocapsales cyanobacterium LEGE 06147]|nr:PAS domain S-box protein [Pleurocapsales cyanobacterium LEGE 06147]